MCFSKKTWTAKEKGDARRLNFISMCASRKFGKVNS